MVNFNESIDIAIFDRDTKTPWTLFLGDQANWSQPLSGPSGRSASGSVRVDVKDYKVQEDARQITWKGKKNKKAQVYWQTTEPISLKPLVDMQGVLSFTMRLDKPLKGDAFIRMDCGWPCSSAINVSKLLESSPLDQWQDISIPVSCFAGKKLNIERVDTPFVMEVSGSLQLSLAEVSILEKPKSEPMIDCEPNLSLADYE